MNHRLGSACIKLVTVLLAALIAMGTAACAVKPSDDSVEATKRRLIIDTDTGADDASALILAAKNENVEILGVTVLVGNVDMEQGTKNALMALEVAGSDAPVYKGARDNLNGEKIDAVSIFGDDGMGDADLIHPTGKAREQDAVDFILESIKKYPGEVEIVALGPATNLANAIRKDPETMHNVKRIWSMGTTGLGPGNASPVAEFNVYSDAPAYKEMLDSGIETTIMGYDICRKEAEWTDDDFRKLSAANETGMFVAKSFGKIREFYASNRSEKAVTNCDGLAMTCVLDPDFVKETVSCHASCLTEPDETYAQVIFYQKGFQYDVVNNDFDYNVTLVTKVDAEKYFDKYLSAIK